MKIITTTAFVLMINSITAPSLIKAHFSTYEDARKSIIQTENRLITGGRIRLNSKELQVSKRLIKQKQDELSRGLRNDAMNAAGLHFFRAKKLIDQSKVFQFLRQMPKGAILHAHNAATVSSDWVVRNLTYMPGLLRCRNKEGVSILSFRRAPQMHKCQTPYVRVSDERSWSSSVEMFDRNFENLFNLHTPIPELEYPSITSVWKKFQSMFATISDMLRYIPVYRAFHWQMLEEMYDDNVMYAEIRMDFKELYDSTGRAFPHEFTVKEFLLIVQKFRQQHPNFMGIKVIFPVHRDSNQSRIREEFNKFKELHRNYPNFVIGFDFVGQEDKGRPLHSFVKVLSEMPKTARYFFHAGETNWYGTSSDFNLLDAILLNTTRIGHGYALMKHPVLLNVIKNRDIAIEVNPISNQVLHLVSDLRNHPAAFFMSQNIPFVISNDDPGFWNAKGLSYDFYYALMSLAPSHAGLKILKNLVWNSIRYSVLNESERRIAMAILERSWNNFLDDVLKGFVF